MRDTYYTTSWQGLLLDTEEEYEELILELNNASPKTTHIYLSAQSLPVNIPANILPDKHRGL